MESKFFNEYLNWIISVLIGLIVLYLVKFYSKVFSLPKGPFPLPIIGNILIFRNTKDNQFVTINELHKTYGKVFTIWLGTTPAVVIGDYELAKKGFNAKNNDLMGRPDLILRKLITQNNGYDIAFSDHGPVWASLRRVAHSAVRKLAVSDKFADLVDDVVNDTVLVIKKNVGINKAFDPKSYVYHLVYNIIASSAFGKRYSWNDKELKFFENSFEYLRANSDALAIPDRVPILKPLYGKTFKNISEKITTISQTIRNKYREHLKDHQKDVIRDFCDALIDAKEEAIEEEKESAPHLNDTNLSLVVTNFFVAGSDTTQYTIRWIILFMANYPEMQSKMRNEIEEVIGDRIATHEDKTRCHYINAFISETLRMRGVAPLGLPHRALADYKLDDYNIHENSFVFANLYNISRDPSLWKDPEHFNPNRFLTSEGHFNSQTTGFTPFGIGRRSCVGEKLALADLFLITIRLLKSTSDYMIELPAGEGTADLQPNPNTLFFNTPNPYEIILKKK